MSRGNLSTRDWTHRDMLRSTAAMIASRWPGRYGDLLGRLEAVARLIELTGQQVCELPHRSIEEEEECDRKWLVCPRCRGSEIDPEDDPIPGSSWELPGSPPCHQCGATE